VSVFESLFEGGGIMLPSICVLRWAMGLIFAFGKLSSFVLYCAFP
jgi:hypothetical protein